MKLKNIDLPMPAIEEFCHKWNLSELALFGSVLRDDFKPESSDIDVMVTFHPKAEATLRGFDYFGALDQIEEELKSLFGREVDVITRAGVDT
ncbi:MAG: nucleotidyltransferase domain-containing protein [Phormidesmis sp.]